ncbi:PucR family transcriptional regulator [Paenibacillus sp. KN14-4R]|uniref:PucR family transcriptional regulator n=1 Tax=Paenibacillus sp. KN14-4R TaxID=3445773 RepID=UPI003FA11903
MNWEQIREQLETILERSVGLELLTKFNWEMYGDQKNNDNIDTAENELFFLEHHGDEILVLTVRGTTLSHTERALIELMIRRINNSSAIEQASRVKTEEQVINELQIWVLDQLKKGSHQAEMPNSLIIPLQLQENRIPLLLSMDNTSQEVTHHSFQKLLDSFFSGEIILLPLLEKEWLILASEELLASKGNELTEGSGTIEEELSDIGSGLHEMLEAEWGLECSIAIAYPCIPDVELIASIHKLRETITVGRTFHGMNRVHMSWQLHFEAMMFQLSDEQKSTFLHDVLKGNESVLDSETLSTLEQFFVMDCNVSETAKKLYIHRNTLLYRLDKFKQEVGLDVRTFSDAVLVKMCMALYKVNKRRR